jgi:hypothetical protein
MLYKVLDLRTGECLRQADMYWVEEEATYCSKQAAEEVIDDVIRIRNDWNPYDDCKNLIREYFVVIEVE